MSDETNLAQGEDEASAPVLLVTAARLVEQAMRTLDTRTAGCGECGRLHLVNLSEGRAHEQLSGTPEKLRRMAALLRQEPEALGAKAERRRVDEAQKKATV